MKIEWIRIKDFRSIIDSGKLYVDPMLTVLAGKNESGKSNILRALEVFSTGGFSTEDYPEGKERAKSEPIIEVSFRMSLEDIKINLAENYKNRPLFTDEYYDFVVCKFLDTDKHYTYGSIQKFFFSNRFFKLMTAVNENLVKLVENEDFPNSIRGEMKSLYLEGRKFLDIFQRQEEPIYWLIEYKDKMQEIFKRIDENYSLDSKGKRNKRIKEVIVSSDIIDQFFALSEDILMQHQNFEEKVIIPKFRLLKSFERPLPDSVQLFDETDEVWASYIKETLEGNEGKGVLEMSNREIKRALDRISKEITLVFQSVYSQNRIKLELDLGVNNTLDVYIYDDINHIDFMPSQRSKGFQWFLSFFFAINAAQSTGNVILLDEPGPYLHPKAQNDVLNALEVLAKSDQIIFTTHSPYLINPDTLERVRLVTRDSENYTVVQNQVHATPIADKEVYTPIMTAIGLDLSKSFGTFGDNNVIVEGISDYYYLESMKEYINFEGKSGIMRFIPSIGVSKIDKLASLLIGWGVNFKVLLDNDKAGKDERKKLKDRLLLSEEQMIFVSDEPEFAIEDLFSREDFLKYIMPDLEVSEQDGEMKNSSLFKGKSKALFAKSFKENLQKEANIKFTSQTIDNFTNLFRHLYGVNDVKTETIGVS
ncbi:MULTISPECIES: AAA family ATPase [Bacillus cereus group]|uniref:AAA family ATPase n=1 Tax=Bacillus cereus group TaxID=86661 RepID=UPI00119E812C|nr:MULTISPECIES: AAA family ATPase [Bacillus cereus group]MCB5895953.1 AAA family ATPase [Bacillus cereus]